MALIDDVITAITTYRDQAVSALNALSDFRPDYYTPSTIDAPVLTATGEITGATITSIADSDIALTDPNENPYTALTADALPSVELPALDTTAASDFSTQMGDMAPTLFAAVEAEVSAILANGGANIAAAVQNAVFQQGVERRLQIAQDALDLTGARTGSKGFRYPNSMTMAQQTEIALNLTWQENDISRQIVKETSEIAQRNLTAALSAGVSVDEAKVRVFTEMRMALNGAQQLAIDKYKVDLQANLQEFEETIQLQIADLGVQRADREEMRAFISAQREQLTLDNQVRVATFEAKAKAEYMRVETDRMVEELKRLGNDQAIRLFAAQTQQSTAVLEASMRQSQHQNDLAVGVLENVAKTYTEMMNSLSGQGVAVDITKH